MDTVSTILAEVVGFLIVLYVLYRYVVPPLRTMVADREKQIARQVEESREAREAVEAARARYDTVIADTENEAARIRDDARADAERILEEGRERAEEEAVKVRRRGQEALENSRLSVVRTLRRELGVRSTDLADRMVREELASEGSKQASVDSFLDELEGSLSSSSTPASAASTSA